MLLEQSIDGEHLFRDSRHCRLDPKLLPGSADETPFLPMIEDRPVMSVILSPRHVFCRFRRGSVGARAPARTAPSAPRSDADGPRGVRRAAFPSVPPARRQPHQRQIGLDPWWESTDNLIDPSCPPID